VLKLEYMKKITFGVLLLIIIGLVVFIFTRSSDEEVVVVDEQAEEQVSEEGSDTEGQQIELQERDTKEDGETVLGTSVEGNEIKAFHYGDLTADKELVLIAGVHGSYSRNTTLLARELMDYLEDNGDVVPDGYMATVIPLMNPDGFMKSSRSESIEGRFNANDVDLNRNFDCQWNETSKWRSTDVSGGSAPFSEPGYQAYETFDFYEITGDMVNWFAKNNIPAISVLLSGYEATEFAINKDGVEAFFDYYK
jgi:hypothetical protein